MRICTTTKVTGLDGKEHFAVVALGQTGWPIALFGPTEGANAKKSEDEAKFFADAPAMSDLLEALCWEFGNFNQNDPVTADKAAFLASLVERAGSLLEKHGMGKKVRVAA